MVWQFFTKCAVRHTEKSDFVETEQNFWLSWLDIL